MRRRLQRSSRALYLVALIAFLLAGSGLLANGLLDNLQEGLEVRTDRWGTANAIVLLGGGSEMTDQGPEMSAFSYGRLVKDPGRRARREAAGLAGDPLAVLLSRRLEVPWDAPLFAEPARVLGEIS